MDYIIFGIGTGSSLLLFGWLLRDMGPALRDRQSRAAAEVLGAQQLVDQMRWARFCAACGIALAMSGALLLLVTVFAMLINPSDAGGTWAVMVTFAIVAVAMLVWTGLFVSRFGIAGIYRAKPAAPGMVAASGARAVADDADLHDDDFDDDEYDIDDATGDAATEPNVAVPSPVPVMEPSPQEPPSPAPPLVPKEESIAAREPAPDELQRVRIETSEAGDAVAADARDDDIGNLAAADRPGIGDETAVPDVPVRVSSDAENEPDTVNQDDQSLPEPVVSVANREEVGSVVTVPPGAGPEERPAPVEPESSEHPGATDATPVPENLDHPDASGNGIAEEPAATSGRVKALRQLQQRRQR